jgi:hypothetical protein
MAMKEPDACEIPWDLLDRFPTSGGRILELFFTDEDFRELCGDYQECSDILDRLHHEQVVADKCIEEYTEMRRILEQELYRRIAESADSMPEMGGR